VTLQWKKGPPPDDTKEYLVQGLSKHTAFLEFGFDDHDAVTRHIPLADVLAEIKEEE